jgi:regulator of replication initiation timing
VQDGAGARREKGAAVPIVNVTDISKDHVAEAIARMEMDIQTVARSHRGLSSGYMKLLREIQSLEKEADTLRELIIKEGYIITNFNGEMALCRDPWHQPKEEQP